MSFFSIGTPCVCSTQGIASNPTTSALIAEIDSTSLGNHITKAGGANFQVTWILGYASTAGIFWQLEAATSTALNAGKNSDVCPTFWPLTSGSTGGSNGQSAQFVTKMRLERGDRLRARVATAFNAGNAQCNIIAEPLD